MNCINYFSFISLLFSFTKPSILKLFSDNIIAQRLIKSIGWWKLAKTVTHYIFHFFLLKVVHLFMLSILVIILLSCFWFALFSKKSILCLKTNNMTRDTPLMPSQQGKKGGKYSNIKTFLLATQNFNYNPVTRKCFL